MTNLVALNEDRYAENIWYLLELFSSQSVVPDSAFHSTAVAHVYSLIKSQINESISHLSLPSFPSFDLVSSPQNKTHVVPQPTHRQSAYF